MPGGRTFQLDPMPAGTRAQRASSCLLRDVPLIDDADRELVEALDPYAEVEHVRDCREDLVGVNIVNKKLRNWNLSVRPTMVQAFVKGLEDKGLSPGTTHGIFHVLTAVFSAAVDDRVISVSPCRRITLPRANGEEVVPPTLAQVAAFRDALPELHKIAAIVLAGAGPRIGEALGLHVSDVDFLRRTVSIERQRRQDGTLGPLKSKK